MYKFQLQLQFATQFTIYNLQFTIDIAHNYLKIVSFILGKSAVTRIRTWVTAATTQGPNH